MQAFTGLEGKTQIRDGLLRHGDTASGLRPHAREASQAAAPAFRRWLYLGWHRRLGPGPPALPPRCASTATRNPQDYCGRRRRLRARRGGEHGRYGAAGRRGGRRASTAGVKGNSREPEPQGRCRPAGPRGHGPPPPGRRRRRLGAPSPPPPGASSHLPAMPEGGWEGKRTGPPPASERPRPPAAPTPGHSPAVRPLGYEPRQDAADHPPENAHDDDGHREATVRHGRAGGGGGGGGKLLGPTRRGASPLLPSPSSRPAAAPRPAASANQRPLRHRSPGGAVPHLAARRAPALGPASAPPPVLGPARGGVGSWLSPAPAGNGGAKGQALGARAASELLGKLGGGEEGPAGEPAAASPKTFPETATQGQEKNRRKIQSANREA